MILINLYTIFLRVYYKNVQTKLWRLLPGSVVGKLKSEMLMDIRVDLRAIYTSSPYHNRTREGLLTHGKESTSFMDKRSSGFFASMFFTSSKASEEISSQSSSTYSIRWWTVLYKSSSVVWPRMGGYPINRINKVTPNEYTSAFSEYW